MGHSILSQPLCVIDPQASGPEIQPVAEVQGWYCKGTPTAVVFELSDPSIFMGPICSL